MQTVDLARMKDAVGFSATFPCWGNRRKANIDKVTTDSDKTRLRLSKELIVSDEYDAIKSFQGAVGRWLDSRTVPSFFRDGFKLTGISAVEEIDEYMKERQKELESFVDALIAVYPAKIEEAQQALNGQFNIADYPDVPALRRKFAIEWNWIAFTVPEGLPPELKAIEAGKLEQQFKDAGEQITLALREGFQELVAHASRTLKTEPGEKPKVFRDSLVGNILEFIDTFNGRNLLNDAELAAMVDKAKVILAGVNPDSLRKNGAMRDNIASQFAAINTELTGMVEEVKGRVFDLE